MGRGAAADGLAYQVGVPAVVYWGGGFDGVAGGGADYADCVLDGQHALADVTLWPALGVFGGCVGADVAASVEDHCLCELAAGFD